ncbi:vacuolar protein sorting-associated protein 72 homolog [Tribolium castaneum]|uniref:Vacuolar protein sorting-associated protein 72 homolog n=1 Tax=Tribolium castaneum TaxID=7070 RepID=D6W8K1_TRICA|nr:PREDICTED: vacuolar protein sorting-associated protein 72 homolog [Tribolium castaneum]EEZ98296.2 Vacuolar protein sorting-associated protein 72 homolog-like Protein [Tribolium castaneum]|eukprot:XP_008201355.1 PREDICTED: vacuolar protein sorting-associated protein 72 homolog [Tribolium castaneum]
MAKREKRANAGNRMAKLLDEEEECQDEFYKTNYGGFEETESDREYEEEEEGEDVVDSDFSIDENDEPISDNEEEGQKKKRRLVTKAYKEPVPAPSKQKAKPKPTKPVPKVRTTQHESTEYERKSIRKSTAAKSAATAQRIKVRNLEQKKKIKKPKEEEWVPTQEELLEEAKTTELENLKSLEKYQKMESEKKTKRTVKKVINGPVIQYRSTRMPIIEEINQDKDIKNESENVCERTFISVLNDPNDATFNSIFEKKTARPLPRRLRCIVTGHLAKYVDPKTCLPYHSSMCLKIIRSAYYQQLEAHGDKSNPVVANWLKWYVKNKDKLRRELALKVKTHQVDHS